MRYDASIIVDSPSDFRPSVNECRDVYGRLQNRPNSAALEAWHQRLREWHSRLQSLVKTKGARSVLDTVEGVAFVWLGEANCGYAPSAQEAERAANHLMQALKAQGYQPRSIKVHDRLAEQIMG